MTLTVCHVMQVTLALSRAAQQLQLSVVLVTSARPRQRPRLQVKSVMTMTHQYQVVRLARSRLQTIPALLAVPGMEVMAAQACQLNRVSAHKVSTVPRELQPPWPVTLVNLALHTVPLMTHCVSIVLVVSTAQMPLEDKSAQLAGSVSRNLHLLILRLNLM